MSWADFGDFQEALGYCRRQRLVTQLLARSLRQSCSLQCLRTLRVILWSGMLPFDWDISSRPSCCASSALAENRGTITMLLTHNLFANQRVTCRLNSELSPFANLWPFTSTVCYRFTLEVAVFHSWANPKACSFWIKCADKTAQCCSFSYLGTVVTMLDDQILTELQLSLSVLKLEHLESRKHLGIWQMLIGKQLQSCVEWHFHLWEEEFRGLSHKMALCAGNPK